MNPVPTWDDLLGLENCEVMESQVKLAFYQIYFETHLLHE